mmetsp:Transcript_4525/g.11974  ORF Transcript_4525/g.11974 Transcript_4525/m.11974 type:complete len:326 (-) Transcript_4525:349-1326(-)
MLVTVARLMTLIAIAQPVNALFLDAPQCMPIRSAASRSSVHGRREVLDKAAAAAVSAFVFGKPSPAHALIKGSAPPPKMAPKERKCKSIDECEALGEKTKAEAQANERTDFERTSGGDRYRDLITGDGKAAATGDVVELRYRVMRLGTKARDGLSGEGQTIFSFGYGEDEDKEGDVATVQIKGQNLIPGVNDAVLGMQPGGKRRVLVRPERGWKLQTGACKDGEKSLDLSAAERTTATDGNLVFKADIGAAIENENACQNKVSLPQPRTYGAKARFGRRFDESLLVELDLIGFSKGGGRDAFDPKVERCRQNPFADGCDDGKPIS